MSSTIKCSSRIGCTLYQMAEGGDAMVDLGCVYHAVGMGFAVLTPILNHDVVIWPTEICLKYTKISIHKFS